MTFPIETPIVVSAEDVRAVIVHVLTKLGASERESSIQADVLTEADLRGHHSHGLQTAARFSGSHQETPDPTLMSIPSTSGLRIPS